MGRHFLRYLGYFQPNYQHPFWYPEFLVHVIHYFYKKLSLYIQLSNIYLEVVFEWPQRI
jgi:hypothetical protein